MLYLQLLSFCDASENWQLNFQDPASPIAEGILFFNNYLMFFLIAIGIFVSYFLYQIITKFSEEKNKYPQKFTHFSLLEFIWTVIPALILLFISIPSFALLYSLDELIEPSLTLKVIGHQWYWSYEYSDCLYYPTIENVNFDSYMIATSDLITKGSFRLLEVDNRVLLPVNTHIRLLITSADVLHSWAIPSFGIKIDACPGRLSQGSLLIKREGVFYGQCSEICGINHGFMPIVIKTVSVDNFLAWILSNLKSD
jgi:cytochrome c oxidase subunit 2